MRKLLDVKCILLFLFPWFYKSPVVSMFSVLLFLYHVFYLVISSAVLLLPGYKYSSEQIHLILLYTLTL